MLQYEVIKQQLLNRPRVWLVTGVAGFIGSNLLEALLRLEQYVVGIDNLSTGFIENLDEVKANVSDKQWKKFNFKEGDICKYQHCEEVMKGVEIVLHQAALGSVPRSIDNPLATNDVNVNGFLNIITAAKEASVERFIYAASSSTYGDHPALPKVEEHIGKPLSPYAVTKYVNELYAEVFKRTYNFDSIGLRYFNVFGKRQNPDSQYSAVIPRWIVNMMGNERISINGDGETSRDFCYVENIIQANLLAALASLESQNQIYNVAVGEKANLIELFELIKLQLSGLGIEYVKKPVFKGFREGDVKHSLAQISKIEKRLHYQPYFNLEKGLNELVPWFVGRMQKK